MVYTTAGQVERYLAQDIPDAEQLRVAGLMRDATDYVDLATGCTWQTAVTETRNYECAGDWVVEIDDAQAVTAVTLTGPGVDPETLVVDEGFYLVPGGSGEAPTAPYREPITGILRAAQRWPKTPWYVTVSGTWQTGNEVPADIARATALIVAATLRALGVGSSAAGDVASESWDGYSVSYVKQAGAAAVEFVVPASAEDLLARYSRDPAFVEGV